MTLKEMKVSTRWVSKVTNPLPVPTICPNCGSAVELINNSVIYRKECGRWPFAYKCVMTGCDSYVGVHEKTDIPKGTLADKATRAARKMAHATFDPIFDVHGVDRTEAYAWLAKRLFIADVNHCHIGWFNIEQCNEVVKICIANPKGPQ